jgi:hypothetical protein
MFEFEFEFEFVFRELKRVAAAATADRDNCDLMDFQCNHPQRPRQVKVWQRDEARKAGNEFPGRLRNWK